MAFHIICLQKQKIKVSAENLTNEQMFAFVNIHNLLTPDYKVFKVITIEGF